MAATSCSQLALGLRSARKYAAVNGGVLIVAWLVTSIDWVVHSCTASTLASAALGTAALYGLVYRVCAANLYGRRRIFAQSRLPAIPIMALIWHPLGTMLERMLHGSGSTTESPSMTKHHSEDSAVASSSYTERTPSRRTTTSHRAITLGLSPNNVGRDPKAGRDPKDGKDTRDPPILPSRQTRLSPMRGGRKCKSIVSFALHPSFRSTLTTTAC